MKKTSKVNKKFARKAKMAMVSTATALTLLVAPVSSVPVHAAISTSATLRPGSAYSNSTLWLQKNLNVLGYNCGTADGKYGTATANGVKAFQRAYGLTVDGIAGSRTISKVNEVSTNLQKSLNAKGFGNLTVDGLLGNGTVTAINRAKSAMGLSQNGIADKTFINRLESYGGGSVSSLQNKILSSWVKPVYASYLTVPGTGRAFGASRSNGRKHAGIDYYVRNGAGTPVYAMESGTVVEYSSNFYAGTQAVAIKHADGSIARYCEISTSLRTGNTVSRGQQIGSMKANTADGGTMLHLELYKGSASGSLSNTSNSTYNYVSGSGYNRRSDLMDPTFLLNLTRSR